MAASIAYLALDRAVTCNTELPQPSNAECNQRLATLDGAIRPVALFHKQGIHGHVLS